MTREDCETLKAGDKVYHIEDKVNGVVLDSGYHGITVEWSDGQIGQVSHADSKTIKKA